MFIPLAAKFHYTLVMALRLLTGIAQGFMYPACLPLVAKWAPSEERGTITSFLAAGSSLGTILATAITGPICNTGHWYINFVLLGKHPPTR
jgi:MFS family permease